MPSVGRAGGSRSVILSPRGCCSLPLPASPTSIGSTYISQQACKKPAPPRAVRFPVGPCLAEPRLLGSDHAEARVRVLPSSGGEMGRAWRGQVCPEGTSVWEAVQGLWAPGPPADHLLMCFFQREGADGGARGRWRQPPPSRLTCELRPRVRSPFALTPARSSALSSPEAGGAGRAEAPGRGRE